MNKRWNKDGLTRKRQEEQLRVQQPFHALEEDFSSLFTRALHAAGFIRYYSSIQAPDGSFVSLYDYQPLVILNEIKQFDTQKPEQEFLKLSTAFPRERLENRNKLKTEIYEQLRNWHKRLNHQLFQTETSFLQTDVNQCNRALSALPLTDGRSTQRIFYVLIRFIRGLQDQYEHYLDELMKSGTTDPSLAVLIASIKNYQYLVRQFNDRWKKYPQFYLQRILEAKSRKATPPTAWFLLKKNDAAKWVTVPEQTGFMVTLPPNNETVCYRSRQSTCLNDMQLSKISTLLIERDKEKYPANSLHFVTAILQKDVSHCIEILPEGDYEKKEEILFEHQHLQTKLSDESRAKFASTGLMIESPMLLLREGMRHVKIRFIPDEESVRYFSSLLEQIQQIAVEKEDVDKYHTDTLLYKMLNDAFYLEISTTTGWSRIINYTFTYQEKKEFCLQFYFDETFKPTVPCGEPHGCQTQYPALRMLMNRDAWLFPYSWATQIRLNKLILETTVSGITSLEIHNELGQIDPTTPFPPFGSQPEKGAWLAAGSYEMAIKPVLQVGFYFRWQQLPTAECGFYDRYAGYPNALDNTSFKVRLEQLTDKKWRDIPNSSSFLFATTDSKTAPTPRGGLSDYSTILCHTGQPTPVIQTEEERFRYGQTRSGFFRIVLETPDMGFGHAVYRRLFADTMMKNSFRRKKVSPPEAPVTPLLDGMEAEYTAQEEYSFIAGNQSTHTQMYHISPMDNKALRAIDTTRPVPMAIAPQDEGNLLFSIHNALDNDLIRLFIEMAPQKQEVEKEYLPQTQWYYQTGNKWIALPPEAIYTDTTGNLLNSGLVEIALPHPVTEEQLDENGDFRLVAGILHHTINCSAVRSFYLNPIEALLEITEDTEGIPSEPLEAFSGKASFEQTTQGLTDVYQIAPCRGGRPPETPEDTRIRVTQRISHRQRAVTPEDYEQMVLAQFPEVEKVLCLPAMDSKQKHRKAIVTLVVMQKETNKQVLPLCEHRLLLEIEEYISRFTSPFVTVDAIAPIYEEVTVCCHIENEEGQSAGEIIRQAEKRINYCIAPWMKGEEIPAFAHSFSSTDLYNTIREDDAIRKLEGLSALQVISYRKKEEKQYRLNRYSDQEKENFMIAPSAPWCILVPAEKHLLYINPPDASLIEPGIGDLRIGGTFIINK